MTNLQNMDMIWSGVPENESITANYFWSLTNKGRHDLIKRHSGKYWKHLPPRLWGFLFYDNTDFVIRVRVNRKREIVEITTHTTEEGKRLADLAKAAFDGLKHNHN